MEALYFFLGVAASWAVFSLMHHDPETPEKLRRKYKRPKLENGWLKVKLAGMKVNVPEYLAASYKRHKWFASCNPDVSEPPTFFKRLALATTTVILISSPVIAMALMK